MVLKLLSGPSSWRTGLLGLLGNDDSRVPERRSQLIVEPQSQKDRCRFGLGPGPALEPHRMLEVSWEQELIPSKVRTVPSARWTLAGLSLVPSSLVLGHFYGQKSSAQLGLRSGIPACIGERGVASAAEMRINPSWSEVMILEWRKVSCPLLSQEEAGGAGVLLRMECVSVLMVLMNAVCLLESALLRGRPLLSLLSPYSLGTLAPAR